MIKIKLLLKETKSRLLLLLLIDLINKDFKSGYANSAYLFKLDLPDSIYKKILFNPWTDVNVKDYNSYTPLLISCIYGNAQKLKLLLTHPDIDVNYKRYNDDFALKYTKGDPLILKILLTHPDIDVNLQDTYGKTALMDYMSEEVEELEGVYLLLNHPKLDVSIEDRWGQTLIFYAQYYNYNNVLLTLLKNPKVDINLKDDNSKTVLMYACEDYNTEAVKLLLTHPKIDVMIRDKERYTALFYAKDLLIINLLKAHSSYKE